MSSITIFITVVEQLNCPSTKVWSVGGIQLIGLSDTQRRMWLKIKYALAMYWFINSFNNPFSLLSEQQMGLKSDVSVSVRSVRPACYIQWMVNPLLDWSFCFLEHTNNYSYAISYYVVTFLTLEAAVMWGRDGCLVGDWRL